MLIGLAVLLLCYYLMGTTQTKGLNMLEIWKIMAKGRNLEQELAEEIGAANAVPFRFRLLSAAHPWDEELFAAAFSEWADLQDYAGKLRANPFDLGARRDLSGLLTGSKGFHVGLRPESVQGMAKKAFDHAHEGMARYVEKHGGKLLDKIEGENLLNLVMSVPLYLRPEREDRAEDREHNFLVGLINEVKTLGEAQKEDSEKETLKNRRKLVMAAYNPRDEHYTGPRWAAEFVAEYGGADDAIIANVFKARYAAKQQLLLRALARDEEHLDEKRMRALIEDSLEEAYYDMGESEDESDRNDIWEKDIRPVYMEIAKAAYESAIKAEVDEANKHEDDRNKGFRSRHEKGMRF